MKITELRFAVVRITKKYLSKIKKKFNLFNIQLKSADILKVTEWLENEDPLTLSIEVMNYWLETGEKKLTYNQTTEFADSEIFKVVNCSKVYFYIF